MLYHYKVESDLYDMIIVRELAGNVTEQIYMKNDEMVKKELIVWNCRRGRVESCSASTDDIIIVPPVINRNEAIVAVQENAFASIKPKLVVFISTDRVTFEKGCTNFIEKVIVYSWIKRSQITDNMVPMGRILEDVYGDKKK